MSFEKSMKRGEQLANKIDKIASTFDIAESSVEEVAELVEERSPVEVQFNNNPIEVESTEVVEQIIQLDILREDFQTIRTTLLDTVKNGRLIVQSLADEMLTTDTERKASMITSFAELTTAINQSLKLLSSIYKEIVTVQKELHNFNNVDNGSGQTVHNTQNNFFTGSTADIIKQLREEKEGK